MFANVSIPPALTKTHVHILLLHSCGVDGFWGQMGKVER